MLCLWGYEVLHARSGRFLLTRSDGAEPQRKRFMVQRFLGLVLSAAVIAVGLSKPAQALPSFARQTGQPCGTCHTDFPGLTPYGRLFKLNGYTAGGGKFRTTLFPSRITRRTLWPPTRKKPMRETAPRSSEGWPAGHQQHLGAADFNDGNRRLHAYATRPAHLLAISTRTIMSSLRHSAFSMAARSPTISVRLRRSLITMPPPGGSAIDPTTELPRWV